MAVSYYFFDNQSIYQQDWQKTIGNVLLDGVIFGKLNDLFTYADASGMQVKVRSGMFHIKGNYYLSDAEQVLPIAAAPVTAGQSRYDLIVGEVDWSTKTMSIKVVTGTPSSTPAIPALTRTASVWQIPIAYALVDTNVLNIAAVKVADMRRSALGSFNLPIVIGTGLSAIAPGVMLAGVTVPVRSKIIGYVLTGDTVGSIQLDIWKDRTANYPSTVADTICHASYKPALVSNRFNRITVWNEPTYLNGAGANWPGHVFDIWETSFFNDMTLLVNVDSATTVKQVCLNLIFARMASA